MAQPLLVQLFRYYFGTNYLCRIDNKFCRNNGKLLCIVKLKEFSRNIVTSIMIIGLLSVISDAKYKKEYKYGTN